MTVRWADPRDVARTVVALLIAAEVERLRRPTLARRYRRMADDMGAAIDESAATVPLDGTEGHARALPPAGKPHVH